MSAQLADLPHEPDHDAIDAQSRVRLMREGLINYSAPFVSALAGLVLVPIMLSALGSQAYGLWIAAFAMAGLVGVINVGLSWSVTRAVALPTEGSPGEEKSQLVSDLGALYLVLGIAGGVLISALGFPVSRHLHLTGHTLDLGPAVFALVGIAFIGDQVVAFVSAVLAGLRRFDVLNAIAIAISVGRAVGIVVLLIAGAGLLAVVAWQVCVSTVTAIGARVALRKLAPDYGVRLKAVRLDSLRPHLGFGVTSLLATAASGVILQTASILIGLVRGPVALTAYTVGQKFPLAVSVIPWRVAQVAFPVVVRETHASDRSELRRALLAGTRWVMVLILPICIELAILAPNILRTWLDHAPSAAPGVLRVTSAAILVDALGIPAMVVLWGANAERRVLQILAAVAAANIGFSLILLSPLGLVGFALGFLLAMVIGSAAFLYFGARTCGIDLAALLSQTLRGLPFPAAACGGATAALTYAIDPSGWLMLIGTALAGALVYVLALTLRGARPEERMFGRQVLGGSAAAARWSVRRAATALRSIRPLVSTWYLIHRLKGWLLDSPARTRAEMAREFERRDPWGYESSSQRARFESEAAMLDAVDSGGGFDRVLEVGCAEGAFTELLASRCRSLLAVDISHKAMERAHDRRAWEDHVAFKQWDLRSEAPLGRFDLVVVVCVLEYLHSPRALRAARDKLVAMVQPGGFLLVGDLRQQELVEEAWWSRPLIVGGKQVSSLFSRHPALSVVTSAMEQNVVLTLLRRDGAAAR